MLETGFGFRMSGGGMPLSNKPMFSSGPYPYSNFVPTKLALIEVIASATLATYIGAGGLGSLIFTGLGLYRIDLLLIGEEALLSLSFVSMLGFDLFITRMQYEK